MCERLVPIDDKQIRKFEKAYMNVRARDIHPERSVSSHRASVYVCVRVATIAAANRIGIFAKFNAFLE